MTSKKFELPEHVKELISARNKLRDHYSSANLTFTIDGNLVGDLGEAVAAERFGLELTGRSNKGIDGYVGKKSVQVKASGTGRGPAFRKVDTDADHLLVIHFDYEGCSGEVIYNGPEHYVKELLSSRSEKGQRAVSLSALRKQNLLVPEEERLPEIGRSANP